MVGYPRWGANSTASLLTLFKGSLSGTVTQQQFSGAHVDL